MQIYYNAPGEYKQPIPADAGDRLRYDVGELRLLSGKLEKEYQEYQHGREKEMQ